MFYNYEESNDNENDLSSFMAINFEKRVNTYFHDGRSAQAIPWDFAWEMGLRTCTWGFALHMGKLKVQIILFFNGLLRLKVETLPSSWDLFTWVGFGTWDHV